MKKIILKKRDGHLSQGELKRLRGGFLLIVTIKPKGGGPVAAKPGNGGSMSGYLDVSKKIDEWLHSL